jgi:four helix bundle protein
VTAGPSEASGPSLGHARRVQDLKVHRKARSLARAFFLASPAFPREESFALTDELCRASRSIGAQVAKAWAKRKYPRQFVSKSTDAEGGQIGTQHRLTVAFDCGCLSSEDTRRLGEMCVETGQMLGSMIFEAAPVCQPEPDRLHDPTSGYPIGAAAHLTD